MLEIIFINKDASNIGRRSHGEASKVGARIAAVHRPWEKARRTAHARQVQRKDDPQATQAKHLLQLSRRDQSVPQGILLHGNSDPFSASVDQRPLGPLHFAAFKYIRRTVATYLHIGAHSSNNHEVMLLDCIDGEFQRSIHSSIQLHSVLAYAFQLLIKSCPKEISLFTDLGTLVLYHQTKQIESLRQAVEQGDFSMDILIAIICAADISRSNEDWKACRAHLEALDQILSTRKDQEEFEPVLNMQSYLVAIDMEVSHQLSIRPCLSFKQLWTKPLTSKFDSRVKRVQISAERALLRTLQMHKNRQRQGDSPAVCNHEIVDGLYCKKEIQRNASMWSLLLFHHDLDKEMIHVFLTDNLHGKRELQYLQCMYLSTDFCTRLYTKCQAPWVSSYFIPERAYFENFQDFFNWYVPDLSDPANLNRLPPRLNLQQIDWGLETQCLSVLWLLLSVATFGRCKIRNPRTNASTFPGVDAKFRDLRSLLIAHGIIGHTSTEVIQLLSMFVCDETHFGDVVRELCDEPAE